MDKCIIVFGAGKSSTALIEYLVRQCELNNWQLIIADSNLSSAQSKIGSSSKASAVGLQVEQSDERSALVEKGDVIISLLPPDLHFLVAVDCLEYGKPLLTASYMDEKMQTLGPEIENKKILFLCEMGLDPGIDHMSAAKLIHRIKNDGGKIISFVSHCGGLVAPESDDNPWHYKVSWNPRNIVLAGSAGGVYKKNDQLQETKYDSIFTSCQEVEIEGLGKLAYYPNRNSLTYIPVYKLEEASTFLRTTLRYPAYCTGWDAIVKADLPNAIKQLNPGQLTFKKWSEKIIPFVNEENQEQLEFLGLFVDELVPVTARSSADVLQFLLEKKLVMERHDKDMVVMLHQIQFELNFITHQTQSLLIVTGEDSIHTAMAKTVGLPLGIAATLILHRKINVTGLHIPILPEIYDPVLKQLETQGIVFHETTFQISKSAN